jgi:hypothetical protein
MATKNTHGTDGDTKTQTSRRFMVYQQVELVEEITSEDGGKPLLLVLGSMSRNDRFIEIANARDYIHQNYDWTADPFAELKAAA